MYFVTIYIKMIFSTFYSHSGDGLSADGHESLASALKSVSTHLSELDLSGNTLQESTL